MAFIHARPDFRGGSGLPYQALPALAGSTSYELLKLPAGQLRALQSTSTAEAEPVNAEIAQNKVSILQSRSTSQGLTGVSTGGPRANFGGGSLAAKASEI